MIPNLFIDIETAPGPNKPKPEDLKAPGNMSKPETIRAWQEANVEIEYQKQALDSMKGQILCVGLCGLDKKNPMVIHESTEAETMFALNGFMGTFRGQYSEPVHFVGWNILTFDLPWIWRKAIRYNLPLLRDSIPKENRNFVTDLMKVWAADYKDYCSMSSVADFLGIPHEGGNGSEIYELWQNGDKDAINCHCTRDVETSMAIYERIMPK